MIPCAADGEREIVVAVDNTFGDHSALHIENDYYTYGGITRPVVAEWVPEVYIDRFFATPRMAGKTWDLDLKVRIKNWGKRALKRQVLFTLHGKTFDLGNVTVKARGERTVSRTLSGLKVRAWSPDARTCTRPRCAWPTGTRWSTT